MIERLYSWYGKKVVLSVLIFIVILIVFGLMNPSDKTLQTTEILNEEIYVTVAPVYSLSNGSELLFIGTVESTNEARIESETSGRVTAVNVKLGDSVVAGTVIATLENASQRASLLQAEGAYELALASAAQSDVSVEEARNSLAGAQNTAVNVIKTTSSLGENIVFNSFDQFFSNPNGHVPGVRLSNTSHTQYLNSSRVELQDTIPEWRLRASSVSASDDLISELSYTKIQIENLLAITNVFIEIFNSEESSRYRNEDMVGFSIEFINIRNSLVNTLTTLEETENRLKGATDALDKASLGGTANELTTANAQVKQAQGVLAGAQANYEKTIIRTPISGTINSLNVKTGDYVSSFSPIATIANNSALEITTFVNNRDAELISIGDEVLINDTVEGVLTRIAPAISSNTGKVEVVITVTDAELRNGETVRIALRQEEVTGLTSTDRILLPLTAIKLTANNAYVFTVEDSVLVAHEVILGVPNGSHIEVREGLDSTWSIVTDARGLNDGMNVTIYE